jgi:WD40 repeat protein
VDPPHVIGKPLEHQGPITSVAYTPDGRAVLTGSRDGMARLWDAYTGLPVGQPIKQSNPILALAFRPDGRDAVIACGYKIINPRDPIRKQEARWEIHRCNIITQRPFKTLLSLKDPVIHAAFDLDGKTLRTVHPDGVVQRWDTATGRRLGGLTLEVVRGDSITHAAFSPDGRLLVTRLGRDTARIWEVANGRSVTGIIQRQLVAPPDGVENAMEAVKILPDGRTIRTASPTVLDWDAPARWHITSLSPPAQSVPPWTPGFHAASELPVRLPLDGTRVLHRLGTFSPDGKVVLTENRLWDTATGKPIGEVWDLSPGRGTAVFSPDSKVVLTSRFDDLTGRGMVQFWDAATGQALATPLELHELIFAAAFSPDHRLILISTSSKGGEQTVQVWDFTTRRPVGRARKRQELGLVKDRIGTMSFSPDGQTILVQGDFPGRVIGTSTLLWRAPGLVEGNPEHLETWTQILTGMELDQRGGVRLLSTQAQHERRQRLISLGYHFPEIGVQVEERGEQ